MDNFDFFSLKTDLADENDEIIRSQNPTYSGIITRKYAEDGVDIFSTEIKNSDGEKASGKRRGKYVTVNVGRTELYDSHTFERVCKVFSNVVRCFTDPVRGGFLLAGLGNPQICADSVGTQTAASFIVTRHIKESSPSLFERFGFSETSAITPNVFGNTGIEAAEIIKGVVDDIKPACVIAVDSLSSRRLSRLGTTVQICDTGICPGSGVGNLRTEISESTVGVPVIAIGVPTVVNASTLISDILSDCGIDGSKLDDKDRKNLSAQVDKDCYVSPKSCEKEIKSISRLIGYALNSAIHKGISFSEMRDFL